MKKTLTTIGLGAALALGSSLVQADSARQLVLDFVELAFVDKQVREAFDRYVAPDYIQHNPDTADGAEPAIAVLEGFQQQFPAFSYEVKRIASEDDIVFLHVHGKTSPDDLGAAIVDIFRIEDGRIVEHWDVMQPVPTESVSKHPMF